MKALYSSPGRHKPRSSFSLHLFFTPSVSRSLQFYARISLLLLTEQYADIDSRFATKPIAALARTLKLDETMQMDKGVPYVSDSMYATAMLALLGALEVSVRRRHSRSFLER